MCVRRSGKRGMENLTWHGFYLEGNGKLKTVKTRLFANVLNIPMLLVFLREGLVGSIIFLC